MSRIPDMTIAIDSREQRAYGFKNAVVKALRTGDYSIVGLEGRIAIERKTKDDAYKSITQGYARFAREAERLAALDYGAIVVECSLEELLRPPRHARINPRVVARVLLRWSVAYRLPIFFAGTRALGRAVTERLLLEYWHRRHGGVRPGELVVPHPGASTQAIADAQFHGIAHGAEVGVALGNGTAPDGPRDAKP